MTLTCLGQTSYPVQKVIDGDEVILITPEQLKYANRQTATVHYLESRTIGLEDIISSLENSLELQQAVNQQQQKQMNAYSLGIDTYKVLIEQMGKDQERDKKAERKKKRRAIITSLGIGIVGGLLLSVFI